MLIRSTEARIAVCIVLLVVGHSCRESSPLSLSHEQQIIEWQKVIHKDIPPQSKKLEKRLSFPFESQASKEAFMKTPTRISLDHFGNTYVLDPPSNCIFKFSAQGTFIKHLGRGGQGPGEFSFPSLIYVSNDSLVIEDIRNGRIQYLDLEGNFLRSFKIFEGYYSFCALRNGHIYAAPRRSTFKESPLLKRISEDGVLISSFGTFPFSITGATAFNSVVIDVNTKGEVFVAYRLLALVQQYSASGQLLREINLNSGNMRTREKYNLKTRKLNKSDREKKYYIVIESLKATESGFSIIINNSPCFLILEYDDLGKQKRCFYWDEDWSYYARDFAIRSIGGEELFYVVQMFPESCIDVFGLNNM